MNLFDFISLCIIFSKIPAFGFSVQSRSRLVVHSQSSLKLSSDDAIDIEVVDDGEDTEIGTMRVSELKSELKLRGIDYSDCFDKESLAKKLRDARASGKADPTIIDQFNKQRVSDILIAIFVLLQLDLSHFMLVLPSVARRYFK